MSRKITISIPTSDGVQLFYIGRLMTIAILFALIAAPVVISILVSSNSENKYAVSQAEARIEQTKQTIQKKSLHIKELENNNQRLNQKLTEKSNRLTTLGQRLNDVESVLGLSDTDSESGNLALEQRVDAAAINSAVQATMFRMIPNDTPMNYNRVSSSYGNRLNPITKKYLLHKGIDLTCNKGEPIVSTADGVVEIVRSSKKGYGNFLTVRHSFGFISSYAHLQKFKVKRGQFVRKGETIATCGNSGYSTGPHLHYEVRFLGRPLNPRYLMDWNPENFETLFEKEKKVNWVPLVALIDNTVRIQANLTHNPYRDDSVDTAKSSNDDKASVN